MNTLAFNTADGKEDRCRDPDPAWVRWCRRMSMQGLRAEAAAIGRAVSVLLLECPHPDFRDEMGGGSRCPPCREQAEGLRRFYHGRLGAIEAELARRRRAA